MQQTFVQIGTLLFSWLEYVAFGPLEHEHTNGIINTILQKFYKRYYFKVRICYYCKSCTIYQNFSQVIEECWERTNRKTLGCIFSCAVVVENGFFERWVKMVTGSI